MNFKTKIYYSTFLIFFLCSLPGAKAEDPPSLILVKDTLVSKVDVKKDPTMTVSIAYPENDKDWSSIIPSITGSITVFITLISLFFIRRTFYSSRINRNLNFIGEVDKMLIADPQLWQFYNSKSKNARSIIIKNNAIVLSEKECFNILCQEKSITIFSTNAAIELINVTSGISQDVLIKDKFEIKEKGSYNIIIKHGSIRMCDINSLDLTLKSTVDEELEDKLEAFIYYKLNHFEIIILENRGILQKCLPGNKIYTSTWMEFLEYTMRESDRFNAKVSDIIKETCKERKLYREETIQVLKDMYNKIEGEGAIKG